MLPGTVIPLNAIQGGGIVSVHDALKVVIEKKRGKY